MNTIQDIVNILERIAPPKTALEWDNVGLQLGNSRTKVNKLLLALDVTPQAVEMAIQKNASSLYLIILSYSGLSKPLQIRCICN